MPGEAFIFTAKQTFWIARRLDAFSFGNVARIFFGLGKVNCQIKCAVFGLGLPDNIFINASLANVIRGDTELVVIICGEFGRFFVIAPEVADNFARTRHNAIHNPRVEKVTFVNRVIDNFFRNRIVKHIFKNRRCGLQSLRNFFGNKFARAKQINQFVRRVIFVTLRHKFLLLSKIQQAIYFGVNHNFFLSIPVAVGVIFMPRPSG